MMCSSNQWLKIKSKDLDGFSFKYTPEDKHFFYVTNLRQVYSTTVKFGSLAITCPGLEGDDESVLKMIFVKVEDPLATATFKCTDRSSGLHTLEITSQLKGGVEKITFRLENFNELGSDGLFFHLTAPLIHMQALGAAREQRLLQLIAKKDEAITEFIATGASVLPTVDTSPFTEEQLLCAVPEYSSLNDVLEQSRESYSKSMKRKSIKSEEPETFQPRPQTQRVKRNRINLVEAAQKQEDVLISVQEGNAKALPKRKQKFRL